VGTKLATLILVIAPVLTQAARPDRNAYLNRPVSSVAALVSQLKGDPEVADRYMRHFGMSKHDVIAMVSKLHMTRLQRDQPVDMFSVPQGGAIKSHKDVLKKGERVFVDAKGKVILKVKCGNPVVRGREKTELALVPPPLESPSAIKSLAPAIPTPTAPSNTVAQLIAPERAPDIADTVAVAPPVAPNPNETAVVNSSYPGGSKGINGLVFLPILAILPTIPHHHGNPLPPAPEPVTGTLLLAGAASLALRRRRRS